MSFKVIPRFKIRAEGDPVLDGDQVMFLSEEATGQFLTCKFLYFIFFIFFGSRNFNYGLRVHILYGYTIRSV